MIKFQFFGRVGDLTGKMSESLDIPKEVQDSEGLRRWVGEFYNCVEGFADETIRIALDGEVALEPCKIGLPSEIAFLPPVGGG